MTKPPWYSDEREREFRVTFAPSEDSTLSLSVYTRKNTDTQDVVKLAKQELVAEGYSIWQAEKFKPLTVELLRFDKSVQRTETL